MKRIGLTILALAVVAQADTTLAQLRITDTNRYDTATQMLLANEINESGEPYAEALGYDLDSLDPTLPGVPDPTAYILGIENYEYSRYQLGTVIARSGIGLHMMWAPLIRAGAAMETDPDFDGSYTGGMVNGYLEDDELMKAVHHFGHLADQMPPQNAWPQFGEFVVGDPHYAQPVDAAAFTHDFATLRWDRSLMTKELSPAAMGQSLMKQYLWAQDMLGSFHDAAGEAVAPDGTVTPDHPDGTFDPDNGVYFGGDSLDGFVGQVLTAEAINKVKNLIDNLAFDGHNLGSVDPMTYDPASGLRYFPHRIAVSEEPVAGLPPRVSGYEVVDPTSDLFDQASLLWGVVHFADMMDPGNSSDEAHVAYHSVFDGDPFPAPMAETGQPGPYDLMKGTAKVVFQNLMALHFNDRVGTFVDSGAPEGVQLPASSEDKDDGDDEYEDSKWGRHGFRSRDRISLVNAAYALVALESFQTGFAGTPLAEQARSAMASQADFLIDRVRNRRGLYPTTVRIRGRRIRRGGAKGVLAQAAAVRGLYAAYRALGEPRYRAAADEAYEALVRYFYRDDAGVFATRIRGRKAKYDPEVVAVLSGALREARLTGDHQDATGIYISFWNNVAERMQLAEGAATGEFGGDSDMDGIPYIPEQPDGVAPVFAPRAEMVLRRHRSGGDEKALAEAGGSDGVNVAVAPNPFNPATTIAFNIPRSAHVKLAVYDLRGRAVAQLVDGDLAAGDHNVTFKGDELASGVYHFVLDVNGIRSVGKMSLVK